MWLDGCVLFDLTNEYLYIVTVHCGNKQTIIDPVNHLNVDCLTLPIA